VSFSSRLDWSTPRNALSEALERRRAAGAPVLDLTESNPTRAGLPYDAAAVLTPLSGSRSLVYEPSARGLEHTREAIAAAYGYNSGGLVLTASTSEAYSWLFKLLCDPDDEILVPRPSYPLFEYLASLESVRVVRYPLRYHEGWWIDLDALASALTPRSRAIVLVNPNNPTGSYLKHAEFEKLAALCERSGCALISDEVFTEYALTEDAQRVSTLARQDRVLAFSLGGLSKACGLPQMKLAWIAASGPAPIRNGALQRLELIADTFLPAAAPVQHSAGAWLANRALFQEALMRRLRGNLQGVPNPLQVEGGWYAVMRLPRTKSEESWALGLLDECGVLVQPGYFFDFESEAFAVVSLLTEPAVFREGIARLRHYIDARH
jgi:aspartate/methionine/tyrosine aminotransferase